MADITPSLYFCETTDININPDILNTLPIERQLRIKNAIKHEKALQLYLSSLLLGYVLNKYGKKPDDILVTKWGKPYLDNGLCFNISHSGKYAVIAVDNNDVGIDIQEKTVISDAAAKMFICEDGDLSSLQQHEYRYSYIWCRKEAFLKCLGIGWHGKREVSHSVLNNKIVFEGTEYCLTDYPFSENYFLTLCEKSSHKDFSMVEVSKHELEIFCKSDK